jgi:hypothetical protein
VTVVWQRFLSHAYGVPTPLAATVCLALTVWGVYLADHWLDTRPGRGDERTPRHQLARNHPVAFVTAAGLVTSLAVLIALVGLPAVYLELGAGVCCFVALYLLVVHIFRPMIVLRNGGKELAVGVVMAIGVALPLLAEDSRGVGSWWPAVAALASLCWLNCRLIAYWEHQPGAGDSTRSLVIPVLATAAFAGAVTWPTVVAPLGALIILCILHAARRRIDGTALRVLADVALLTPLPLWCCS